MGFEIVVPETEVDSAEVASFVAESRGIVVNDRTSFDRASEFLRTVAAMKRAIEEKFEPAKSAAHKAHKAITSLVADLVGPLDIARSTVSPKIIAWQRAEAERLDLERRAREAEARRIAEEAQLAAAIAAEEDGHDDAAEAIMEESPMIIPTIVVAQPKSEGVALRTTWKAKVVDMAAMLIAATKDPATAALLKVDDAALNARARALKNLLNIPGVEVYAENSLTVSGK